MANTYFWHDYETFGAEARIDRPAQFAGIRTDEDLNVIGSPLVLYCRPENDFLPSPEACLLTGITPNECLKNGVREAEFFQKIRGEMMVPGTCSLGYNSIRFDDEVTRHGLYRNLFDAYEREWKDGNTRWDLINLVRMAYAFKPDCLTWPKEQGRVSFRLERLTEANGIEHAGAHDALSDVRATIALAKLIKEREPKLFKFACRSREKRAAAEMLVIGEPVLHISESYPVDRGCAALVLPIAKHPANANGVIAYDLGVDPEPLLKLSVDDIKKRVFARASELPAGVSRIPLKVIQSNKCPALAPTKVLRAGDLARLKIDANLTEQHKRRILAAGNDFARKVAEVFKEDKSFPAETDPDLMLYSGGFLRDSDRWLLDHAREICALHAETNPGASRQDTKLEMDFADKRLSEMVFRYRARNYPDQLSGEERARWEDYRLKRIQERHPDYNARLDALANGPITDRQAAILNDLRAYANEVRLPCCERANEIPQVFVNADVTGVAPEGC